MAFTMNADTLETVLDPIAAYLLVAPTARFRFVISNVASSTTISPFFHCIFSEVTEFLTLLAKCLAPVMFKSIRKTFVLPNLGSFAP